MTSHAWTCPVTSPLIVLAILVSAGLTAAAHATPIAYEYSGVITSADPSTGVAPGTPFEGTFTYDPAAALAIPVQQGNEIYIFLSRTDVPDTSALTLNIGNQSLNGNRLQVGVIDTSVYPVFGSGSPETIVTVTSMSSFPSVSLQFGSVNRSVDSTLALPTALSLDEFPNAILTVSGDPNEDAPTIYAGTITMLEPIPTPEPSTLVTLAVGLGSLAMRRWHRQRRALVPTQACDPANSGSPFSR